jgi:hypothetical protein
LVRFADDLVRDRITFRRLRAALWIANDVTGRAATSLLLPANLLFFAAISKRSLRWGETAADGRRQWRQPRSLARA